MLLLFQSNQIRTTLLSTFKMYDGKTSNFWCGQVVGRSFSASADDRNFLVYPECTCTCSDQTDGATRRRKGVSIRALLANGVANAKK